MEVIDHEPCRTLGRQWSCNWCKRDRRRRWRKAWGPFGAALGPVVLLAAVYAVVLWFGGS